MAKIFIANYKDKILVEKLLPNACASVTSYPATWLTESMDGKELVEGRDFELKANGWEIAKKICSIPSHQLVNTWAKCQYPEKFNNDISIVDNAKKFMIWAGENNKQFELSHILNIPLLARPIESTTTPASQPEQNRGQEDGKHIITEEEFLERSDPNREPDWHYKYKPVNKLSGKEFELERIVHLIKAGTVEDGVSVLKTVGEFVGGVNIKIEGINTKNLIDYIYEFAWHYGRFYHIGDADKIIAAIKERLQLPEEFLTSPSTTPASQPQELKEWIEREAERMGYEDLAAVNFGATALWNKIGEDAIGFAEWLGKGFEMMANDKWECMSDTYCERYKIQYDHQYHIGYLYQIYKSKI